MPEVTAQVDKDDSLEKLKQECERYGTVNYMSKVNAALREGKSVGEAMQIAHFEIERARLEREVIEAAKEYGRAARATEDHMKTADESQSSSAEGWQLLRDLESSWENFLLGSVYALLEFEAKQK